MKRHTIQSTFSLALGAACAATTAAETFPNRTTLPIPEPQYPDEYCRSTPDELRKLQHDLRSQTGSSFWNVIKG